MMRVRFTDIVLLFLLISVLPLWALHGQTPQELLLSGPMASVTGTDSTVIWVQTTRPAQVQIAFHINGKEQKTFSPIVPTGYDHIAHISLKNLQPDTEYQYELWLNGALYPLAYSCAFRTAPQEIRDIRFAAGSCAWVWGMPYDPKKEFTRPFRLNNDLYRNIGSHRPEFMLWLGDNVYLMGDEMFKAEGIRYRYKYCRSLENLQPFMGQTSHFAIWDDHDYGTNDAESDFKLKDSSLKIFRDYFPPIQDKSVPFKGITAKMKWADVEFFLMDDRFYRNSKKNKRPITFLGKEQFAWLKKELKASTSPFKALVIGSEIYNFTHIGESVWEDFEHEINDLWAYIVREKITGVFVISGDRHYAEVNRFIPKGGGYPIIEYCVSPMLSPPAFFLAWKPNPARLGKLKFNRRNYGIFEVTGNTPANRKLTFNLYDIDGKFIWKHELPLSELQFKP